MILEYIKNFYGIECRINQRVVFSGNCSLNGEGGIIVKDCGNYAGVNFDKDKPSRVSRVHPNELTYGEISKPRKKTAGQKRYQEYLNADYFDGSFSEWLGID